MRSRRDFLKNGIQLSAVAALSPLVIEALVASVTQDALASSPLASAPIPRNQPGLGESASNPADCLVLGAGISGVTAARDLVEQGRASVIVLEGSNRVGGRIHTMRDLFGISQNIEIGAEYIHMQPSTGARIWKDIERYGFRCAKVAHMSRGMIYYPHKRGKQLRTILETGLMTPRLWSIFLEVALFGGPDISAREFLDKRHYTGVTRAMGELVFSGHSPALLEKLSIRGFRADHMSHILNQSCNHHVIAGFDALPSRIARDLDVRLDHVVERVRRTPKGVEVRLTDGREFFGRTAICTFSVGMLRSGRVEFDPPLPAAHQDALRCVEMGEGTKIFLPFTRRFWPKKMAMLNVPGPERRAGKTYFVPHYNEPGIDPNLNPSLTAVLSGYDAQLFKKFDDSEALQRICHDLDQIFPDAAPTWDLVLRRNDVPQMYRKQWADDPFALGAYSYLSVAKTDRVPVSKARGVLGRAEDTLPLLWAGEALSLSRTHTPSTTHGAHWSGTLTAQAVIRHLRLKLKS